MHNLFLIPLVAGTAFNAVDTFTKPLPEVAQIIADAIPKQSNFFINFVMVKFSMNFTTLLDVPGLLFYLIARKRAKSRREKREAKEPPHYAYDTAYAQHLLILQISVT